MSTPKQIDFVLIADTLIKQRQKQGNFIMPKPYAILRIEKLKNMSAVYKICKHNNRTDSKNKLTGIDHSQSHLNVHSGLAGKNSQVMRAEFQRRKNNLTKKPRPDANVGIHVVLTASPEWWTAKTTTPEMKALFMKNSKEWAEHKFGAKNIIATWEHYDEESPHMQILIYPEHDGKLNAKHFLGGGDVMSALQTSFFTDGKMQHLGLNRGEIGSKKVHVPLKQYHLEQKKKTDEALEKAEAFLQDAMLLKKQARDELIYLHNLQEAITETAQAAQKALDVISEFYDKLKPYKSLVDSLYEIPEMPAFPKIPKMPELNLPSY